MAQRKYCKNTVSGRQGRGKKYPAKVRAEVVMAMIGSNSICAVARKYGVPESTIRSWMAEEAGKPDGVFAEARAQAAREIAARAALGARAQVGYLQQRVAENRRASEICTKLRAKLDEDARARDFAIGGLLKSEAEDLQDAANVATVLLNAAANAAALVPRDEGGSQSTAPAVLMEAKDDAEQQEVVLDGTAGD